MTAATSTRRHGVAIVAAVALLAACGDPTGTTVRVDLQTVSAGATHTCALARDGSAYCWGDNEDGQLGDGSTNDSPVPARVSGGHVFTALTTGGLHTCGLVDGVAYCWGENEFGSLGVGAIDVAAHPDPTPVTGNLAFTLLAAGGGHTCGLTTLGVAYCWGANDRGQVGDRSTTDRPNAVMVEGGLTFVSLSAGGSHTCGLTAAGTAYCWGGNFYGQLGDGDTAESHLPVAVAGGHGFAAISAGATHTCAVTLTSVGYCWGSDRYGQVGDGSGVDAMPMTSPAPVAGGLRFSAVTAGEGLHTCGLTTTGELYCWGYNFYGELGDGSLIDRSAPARVSTRLSFTTAVAGGSHSCGRTKTVGLYCWGFNVVGQLGDGTMMNSAEPVRVADQP